MTAVKSLGLNLVMLAVTIGILYWALQDPEAGVSFLSKPLNDAAATTEAASPSSDAATPGPALSGEAPAHAPAQSASVPPPPTRPVTGPLDLNTAGPAEFMELPGIGDKLARQIVQYRRTHGGFTRVEDLRKVPGIGPKRLEQLRPFVKITAAHE